LGIKAGAYHAKMSDMMRTTNQQDFNRDNLAVIVATIAFGTTYERHFCFNH
jgi:superfamily II DNA helicase RecQ